MLELFKGIWKNKLFNKQQDMTNKIPQQGWQCPICNRIYSPSTIMCVTCPGETIKDIEKHRVALPIVEPIVEQIVQRKAPEPVVTEPETLNARFTKPVVNQPIVEQPVQQTTINQPYTEPPVRKIIDEIEFTTPLQQVAIHNFEPRIGVYGPEGELCKICGVHRSIHPQMFF